MCVWVRGETCVEPAARCSSGTNVNERTVFIFPNSHLEEYWASVGSVFCHLHRWNKQALPFVLSATASSRCDKTLLWQVLHTPVEDRFVSWLLVSTVSIKPSLLCCLCFCFRFPFFVLNSTTGKFIMRVTHPTSPHPLPICCCALERRGNRHWSLLPSHMHAHTPPSTSLSIDMFNVFVGNSWHFLFCHFTSVPYQLLTL